MSNPPGEGEQPYSRQSWDDPPRRVQINSESMKPFKERPDKHWRNDHHNNPTSPWPPFYSGGWFRHHHILKGFIYHHPKVTTILFNGAWPPGIYTNPTVQAILQYMRSTPGGLVEKSWVIFLYFMASSWEPTTFILFKVFGVQWSQK